MSILYMNIEDAVIGLKDSKQVGPLIDQIVNHPEQMADLIDCMYVQGNWRLCQKAGWPLIRMTKTHPELITPFIPRMVSELENTDQHDAHIRNTVRVLQELDIPEDDQGKLYDLCFNFMMEIKYPTAVRAFSITILSRIAMAIPELQEELLSALEMIKNEGTSGFVNRANKEYARIQKEMKNRSAF